MTEPAEPVEPAEPAEPVEPPAAAAPSRDQAPQRDFREIERAIADIAAGRPVIVVDDEDRENEGDLIFAAEKATPELIAFMVRYTSGYICVPLSLIHISEMCIRDSRCTTPTRTSGRPRTP